MFAQPTTAGERSAMFRPFTRSAAASAACSPMDDSCADPLASASAVTSQSAVVSCAWPLELGAEVVCCQGDSPVKIFPQDCVSGGFASVPTVQRLSRLCSYEEVVHADVPQKPQPPLVPELRHQKQQHQVANSQLNFLPQIFKYFCLQL